MELGRSRPGSLSPASRLFQAPVIGESPREACGVFGVYSHDLDVARTTFFALHALQHRGQESAGIATSNGRIIYRRTAMGLVSQAFADDADLNSLPGHMAVGHTRYSTMGSSLYDNAQPILVDGPAGELALAHNGNVVNVEPLRDELEERGIRFSTSTDSEIIAQLIAVAPGRNWVVRIRHAMQRVSGAYSLVIMTADGVYAARDPLGVRPLVLGKIDGGYCFASETCALDNLGADYLREVEPGEIVVLGPDGHESHSGILPVKNAACVFEFIYFARPDSLIKGKLLYEAREAMGQQLAKEHPVDADLVIAVPDSATAAGIGYSKESGIPFSEGLLKNRYVGRTFIQPDQRLRELGVRLKFNPLPKVLRGKRIVLVDDSIVRGTTTPHVIQLLRKAGVTEIHMRVCAPPITNPCHFGVDMATKYELIAANKTVPEIADYIDADSLGYLSIEGLIEAVDRPKEQFCLACFTGEYPVPVQLEMDKLALEREPRLAQPV